MPDNKKKSKSTVDEQYEKARAARVLELSRQWGVPTRDIYSQINRNASGPTSAPGASTRYWTFDGQGNVARSISDVNPIPLGESPYTAQDIALQAQYPGQGMTTGKLEAIVAAQQNTVAPGSISMNQLANKRVAEPPLKKGGKVKKMKSYDFGGNILDFAHVFNYGGKVGNAYCDVPMLAALQQIEMTPANMIAASGIHIKPENRGKFTAAAQKAGMGVQEYARKILANKDKYSPTLVKRANFARNANKWHKAEYGIDIPSYEGVPLLDKVKALEMGPPGYVKPLPKAQNGFGGPGDPWNMMPMPQFPQTYQMDPSQMTQPVTSALPPGAGTPIDLSQATDQLGYAPGEGPQWEPQGGYAGAMQTVGDSFPNIHINAGAAITGLAGIVTKAAKRSQATNEFARLKRRNLTMPTYNQNAYGTGSQAIGRHGLTVGGKAYDLNADQIKFLKKQGYKL